MTQKKRDDRSALMRWRGYDMQVIACTYFMLVDQTASTFRYEKKEDFCITNLLGETTAYQIKYSEVRYPQELEAGYLKVLKEEYNNIDRTDATKYILISKVGKLTKNLSYPKSDSYTYYEETFKKELQDANTLDSLRLKTAHEKILCIHLKFDYDSIVEEIRKKLFPTLNMNEKKKKVYLSLLLSEMYALVFTQQDQTDFKQILKKVEEIVEDLAPETIEEISNHEKVDRYDLLGLILVLATQRQRNARISMYLRGENDTEREELRRILIGIERRTEYKPTQEYYAFMQRTFTKLDTDNLNGYNDYTSLQGLITFAREHPFYKTSRR